MGSRLCCSVSVPAFLIIVDLGVAGVAYRHASSCPGLGLLCAAAALVVCSGVAAHAQDKVPYGQSRLGLSDDLRDGTLYIPKSYMPGKPMPLLVMLHGFSGWGDNQRSLFDLAEELGFIVVLPESRDITWGRKHRASIRTCDTSAPRSATSGASSMSTSIGLRWAGNPTGPVTR